MRIRWVELGLVLSGCVLVGGCASSQAAVDSPRLPPAGTSASAATSSSSASSTVSAAARPIESGPTTSNGPSAPAAMICGAEIAGGLADLLDLPVTPRGTAVWRDHVYTCTYRLPVGPLVLSVTESPSPASAVGVFNLQRAKLRAARAIPDVGQPAYASADGNVLVRKDNFTLRVDATRLPAVLGPEHRDRADFAVQIATAIISCWTGG